MLRPMIPLACWIAIPDTHAWLTRLQTDTSCIAALGTAGVDLVHPLIWYGCPKQGSSTYEFVGAPPCIERKPQNLPPPLPPPSPHRSHRLNLMMAPSGPKLDFIGASEVRGGCCLFIANGGEKDLRPTRSASVSPLTKSKRNTSSRCLSTIVVHRTSLKILPFFR